MKQKTAIRQLIEKLESFKEGFKMMGGYPENIDEAIEYAKSLEPVNEQQIIDAHFNGMVDKQLDTYIGKERTGQGYFNETFEKP